MLAEVLQQRVGSSYGLNGRAGSSAAAAAAPQRPQQAAANTKSHHHQQRTNDENREEEEEEDVDVVPSSQPHLDAAAPGPSSVAGSVPLCCILTFVRHNLGTSHQSAILGSLSVASGTHCALIRYLVRWQVL